MRCEGPLAGTVLCLPRSQLSDERVLRIQAPPLAWRAHWGHIHSLREREAVHRILQVLQKVVHLFLNESFTGC